ncbi:hypothetical protein [Sphingobium cupriresistens]|uniref:Uncharacterized protein n=1 Tax=Sphingobium cupriresistens LL01 TaxID=1420583 RepID=A0A0J7XWI6_9SPHN|nr:hypothetical protein [Sphingobium cupriresistens]KMS55952.1 hypothetical protein V473_14245 [Sphingobium cupriresistens LL01]
MAAIGFRALGGCDTYTVPVDATYKRPAFDGTSVDYVDYRLNLTVPARYAPIMARNLASTTATIAECASGVAFAKVPNLTQNREMGFQSQFRLKYTVPMNHMCVTVAGGRLFERFETLPTPLKPLVLLQ